ncbi:MAG TPA: ABC transporter permease [Candidatus Dormibacteraeota bacterium]
MSLNTSDPGVVAPQTGPEDEAAEAARVTELAQRDVPPGIVAQSLAEYFRAWWARIRGGESGILPVLLGLAVIAILFQIVSPGHLFFSAENLVNLFQQSAVIMVLAMAEAFALLLGEIDLSVGWMMALGGVVAVQLVEPVTVKAPWWLAAIGALLVCFIVGAVQGTLISRLRLPSFIVTLAGFLILNGVVLILLLLGPFSGYPTIIGTNSNLTAIHNFMWGNIDPAISWIAMAVLVAIVGGFIWLRESGRRRHGLVAPPSSLTLIKIGLIAVVGVVVVFICDQNRAHFGTLEGVPFFIPIVLGILAVWTVLLQRTRYGRYLYAIGGNPEAARRAGVNLARIRTLAFALCAATAGAAGLLYLSLLDGMSNNVPGGQYVLYAVAAAVIGGTSLFGGRGKVIHGVVGGLVIGGIANGMGLLGLDVKIQYIVTGLVLLVAVTIDALSRRAATSGSAARP